MTRDAFADLEAARGVVLDEGERFVHDLERILPESLRAGFDRLCLRQADRVGRLDPGTRATLDAAVDRAIVLGAEQALERLRPSEIWLAPLTAPDLPPRHEWMWPGWIPEWVARWFRGGSGRPSLGDLDDPSNRVWIAICSAAKPLDPVLEEFGFRPERRRIGGGSFGIAARSLPQLDPSGALGQRWRRYRAAYERLSALAASDG